jgi:hypothetical protein
LKTLAASGNAPTLKRAERFRRFTPTPSGRSEPRFPRRSMTKRRWRFAAGCSTLVAEAANTGVEILRLETGVASHAALALYEKTGFKRRGPFADYRPDPLSVFMERDVKLP